MFDSTYLHLVISENFWESLEHSTVQQTTLPCHFNKFAELKDNTVTHQNIGLVSPVGYIPWILMKII